MSEKHDQEYFSDGLAEELLDLLSRVSELQVAARTSAFSFKGKPDDIPTIAAKLHVATVLEGSVRKAGNHIRVTVQLIRADNGYHLWAETYDRKLNDIFKLQQDIAGAVAKELKVSLLESSIPRAAPVRSSEAYENYLKARSLINRSDSTEDVAAASKLLERSLELDPNFAAGWAYLSKVRAWQAQGDRSMPRAKSWGQARAAAERALALDPALADAYAAKAKVLIWYDWDWASARLCVQKTMDLNPRNPEGLLRASILAMLDGRYADARRYMHAAIEEDPLNLQLFINLGHVELSAGNFSLARDVYLAALKLDSSAIDLHSDIGNTYLLDGNLTSALVEMSEIPRDAGNRKYREAGLALVYHALGREQESDAQLSELERTAGNKDAFLIAEVHAYRGESDAAFRWLDLAYIQRDDRCITVGIDPLLSSLRSDGRYAAFLRKMNLT